MAQRGRRTRPDIRSVALGLAKGGLQPAEIGRLLHGAYGPEAPERRTIQSIVSEARQSPDDPWTLAATDADDAALVLPVLRVLLERMEAEGKRFRLTVPQAERIAWLRRAVPDIPLREAGRLALMSTMPPVSYLAWAPWRSEADAAAYSDTAGRGLIDTYFPNEWSDPPANYAIPTSASLVLTGAVPTVTVTRRRRSPNLKEVPQ